MIGNYMTGGFSVAETFNFAFYNLVMVNACFSAVLYLVCLSLMVRGKPVQTTFLNVLDDDNIVFKHIYLP